MMHKIKKNLLYIYAFACFFQAQFLTIDFDNFQLSIGRVIFIIFLLSTITKSLLRIQIPGDYLFIFLVVWFAYQLFNIINGMRFGIGNWFFLDYLVGIYFVFAMSMKENFNNDRDYKRMLIFFNLGIIVQSIIGLFEHVTGIYYWTSNAELFTTISYYMRMRFPCAMQENPNDFAFLMNVGVFISALLIIQSKSRIIKLLWTGFLLCYTYLIYISDSRGVLLGLIMGALYIILSSFLGESTHNAKQVLCTLLLVIVFLGIIMINLEEFINQLSSHLDFSGGDLTRKNLIREGLASLFKTFGLGYGVHGITGWHNHYIEIIAEFGVIIFILFLKFYYELFTRLKRISAQYQDLSVVCLFLRGYLISLILCFVSPASILRIEWFGGIMALLVAFEYYCINNRHSKDALLRLKASRFHKYEQYH